jgi:hypothetical protein
MAPPPIVSGTHPTLFRILDEVIGLEDCEVFSYTPEIDADPHANDFSDDEDDVASVGDEEESGEDEATFEFDNYDVDEEYGSSPTNYHQQHFGSGSFAARSPSKKKVPPPTPRAAIRHTLPSDELEPYEYGSASVQFKRRGALLWSSHWFFFNRKLKRVLFVSVWARSKGIGRSYYVDDSDEYEMDSPSSPVSERFWGWEGATGAGARALGLSGRGV